MKTQVRFLCLMTALVLFLTACQSAENGGEILSPDRIVTLAASGTTTVKTWATRTNSKGEKIPNVYDDGVKVDPANPPEKPITGKNDAIKYHSSHTKVPIIMGSGETENFSPWNDNESKVAFLFDERDGYFNPNEQSKLGGSVFGGTLVITFKTEKSTLVGYALVTGNDSGSYPERSPLEWSFYGSKDGNEWSLIDYVYDSSIEALDHEYFGYEIDDDKQAEYKYYKFEFTLNLNGAPVSSFQLNEMYLYADKK